jgi:hypothetical protein
MKVFVDECVNRRLMRHLSGHAFVHALDTLLRSTKNGELLRAVAPDYDVFLTCDTNVRFQQNLSRFPLAFVVLRSRSNKLEDLLPLAPRLLAALDRIDAGGFAPGDLHEIAPE